MEERRGGEEERFITQGKGTVSTHRHRAVTQYSREAERGGERERGRARERWREREGEREGGGVREGEKGEN